MRKMLFVVDDSIEVHALIKALLANEPVDVQTFLNPLFALKVAETSRPDLILLDVDMPEMGGYEFCKELKSVARLKDISVIFLTSKSQPDEKVHGLNLGAVDYVAKPFHRGELLARIRSALRVRSVIADHESRSLIDSVTGLGNFKMLNDRLAAETAQRARTLKPLTCTYFDLNGFHVLRQRHGEKMCEAVNRRFADLLRATYRREDTICRRGEHDYAVLMPETDGDVAQHLASDVLKKMPQVLSAAFCSAEPVSCSIGIASAVNRYEADLLDRAMQAIDSASTTGASTLWLADPTPVRKPRRVA